MGTGRGMLSMEGATVVGLPPEREGVVEVVDVEAVEEEVEVVEEEETWDAAAGMQDAASRCARSSFAFISSS